MERNFAGCLFLHRLSQAPFPFAMITPTIFVSVMLLAALAVFSAYSRAAQLQPQPIR